MLYIGLFLLSLVLTYIIRDYTLKKSILDIPNKRSSHLVPTPRGGGLAIIITFYVGVFLLKDLIDDRLFFVLFTALPILIVSLIDDIKTLSASVRIVVQMISTFLALYLLGGVDYIDFIYFEFSGWWINILAFIIILWMTNFYNFMDGIDGYAGSQTLTLGLGITFILLNPLGLVFVVASLGFLFFNWNKASIFMGDVGSATLGFIFAILLFSDTSSGNVYFWIVALSLFWFDATLTLFRRYKMSENLGEAHRKHAYQRLVQSGWSHGKVTSSLILFNIIFLILLYSINKIEYVVLINLVLLYPIVKFIDMKKSF